MSEPEMIDVELFYRRLDFFITSWKDADDPAIKELKSCRGILLGEAHPYTKTRALQVFLCGRVLFSTIILITPESVRFLCSETEATVLSPLAQVLTDQNRRIDVEVIVKPIGLAAATSAMNALLTHIERVGSETGQEVGRLRDGKPVEEEFMHEWNDFLEIGGNTDLLAKAPDVSAGVSVILGPKDPQEIYRTEIACQLSRKLMSVVRSGLLGLLKTEDKNTLICKKLRALIKRQQKEGSIWEGAQYAPDVDDTSEDVYPPPTIHEARKSAARSDAEAGNATEIFSVRLGTQYKSYPSDVSRTIMINSCPNQEDNYVYLLELQKFAIKSMKEGIAANELYHAIKAKVATERPELKSSLPQSFGSALGVEFDDSDLSLNAECTRVLKSSMLFSLSLSFTKIQDPTDSNIPYTLRITDTVLVGSEGSTILSDISKELSHISFSRLHLTPDPHEEEQNGSSAIQNSRQSPTDDAENLNQEAIIPVQRRLKRLRSYLIETDDRIRRQRVTSSSSSSNALDPNSSSTTSDRRDHREEHIQESSWPIFKNIGRFVQALRKVVI
ncbi:hypothetical protein Pst134EA_027794 [Puccinia striiformis f. sp. tritici]|uniref:hypothetical protein n=1 Tax=Puccinia striiformis f. sp. tritici TaxID=168172 RepID=UPI0020081691|nr:hypothetical protein Pst134EA_027794 [Puccinia striiformis f. sp. tritici]KAH9448483.1 hypothetical protein Pst134EA_027794 [Puccinia striiformis f. sp. tritici]